MLSGAQRLDQLVTRVSLWLIVFFCAVSVVAIAVVAQHGKPGDAALRLAIPLSVIVSCIAAMVLGRRGWPRRGALLVILTAYATIVLYVVAGGYGLHSYLLSIFALLIVVTALLIGARAGLWVSLLTLATAITLYALERNGLVVEAHAVQTIRSTTSWWCIACCSPRWAQCCTCIRRCSTKPWQRAINRNGACGR